MSEPGDEAREGRGAHPPYGRLRRLNIAIAGAGSIGCFTGGLLASRHNVTLLGRRRILDPIRSCGLHLTDFAGLDKTITGDCLALTDTPADLSRADVVVVAVKSGSTQAMAAEIAAHARPEAPVISFQNGMENAEILRCLLPGRDIRAAMVPFNVVPAASAAFHRASSGGIVIEAGPGDLAEALCVSGLEVSDSSDITAIQWGKLLLNLNNAVNALSGLPLQQQLMSREWRCLMADQMTEALGVLRVAGIKVTSTMPLPAWMGPHVLRLPTPLFTRVAAQMLSIDPMARTSMAYDLRAGRTTEIDSLQGRIADLARAQGMTAPISDRIAGLVRAATARGEANPGCLPGELRPD